jgi:hypothetical protein
MENCNGQVDCTLSNEPMKMDSDNQQEQRGLECCPVCGDTKTFGMTGSWNIWGEIQDRVEVEFICEACGTLTTATYHLNHFTTEAV